MPGGSVGGGFMLMIRQPSILLLGACYTGLKFVRYSFFAWSPYYLASQIGRAKDSAAYVSNGSEIGGILGLATVLHYRMISAGGGILGNAAGLAAIGFFLYIADSIDSGTAAQEIGGPSAKPVWPPWVAGTGIPPGNPCER